MIGTPSSTHWVSLSNSLTITFIKILSYLLNSLPFSLPPPATPRCRLVSPFVRKRRDRSRRGAAPTRRARRFRLSGLRGGSVAWLCGLLSLSSTLLTLPPLQARLSFRGAPSPSADPNMLSSHGSLVRVISGSYCGPSPCLYSEEPIVIPLLTRFHIQALLAADQHPREVAEKLNLSIRSILRIAKEGPVTGKLEAPRNSRRPGRPSQTASYRDFVFALLAQEPDLMSLEVLRRCRLQGYKGGKSALYDLISQLRPRRPDFITRFEGLPGEFSQHDFGQVDVRYIDGDVRRVHFFASRLKWSRAVQVSIVENEQAETLVRTMLDHFIAFGGVPLCAVFDRPKTIALKWDEAGHITEWNPIFACAALDIGFTAELCWPHTPRQKGSVENLVGWVKGSFFKQRRFHDDPDRDAQLAVWHDEVNGQRPCRATKVIPNIRLLEELPRLRPPRVLPQELALRLPAQVLPTAYVEYRGVSYSMPPEAAGQPATLYLYRDRVRIVTSRCEAWHPRSPAQSISTLPEHRCQQLDHLPGSRGKRYLKRQHLLQTGPAAQTFLTELVHRQPKDWERSVSELHDLLQTFGPEALQRAFQAALAVGQIESSYVASLLGQRAEPGRSEGGGV